MKTATWFTGLILALATSAPLATAADQAPGTVRERYFTRVDRKVVPPRPVTEITRDQAKAALVYLRGTYDEAGRLQRLDTFHADRLFKSSTYRYNEAGQVVEETIDYLTVPERSIVRYNDDLSIKAVVKVPLPSKQKPTMK